MGVYKYYTSFNGRPAYHKSNGRRLYFLGGSGWLIGTQVGAQTGFVHHASQYRDAQTLWPKLRDPARVLITTISINSPPISSLCSCPYLIADVGWMYVNQGYWYKDNTLVVRCIQ